LEDVISWDATDNTSNDEYVLAPESTEQLTTGLDAQMGAEQHPIPIGITRHQNTVQSTIDATFMPTATTAITERRATVINVLTAETPASPESATATALRNMLGNELRSQIVVNGYQHSDPGKWLTTLNFQSAVFIFFLTLFT
jgi:hypothetical protein